MVALYHSKKAEQAPDEDKRQEHYREAALFYAEAAETYPADDEYNICMCHFAHSAPVACA